MWLCANIRANSVMGQPCPSYNGPMTNTRPRTTIHIAACATLALLLSTAAYGATPVARTEGSSGLAGALLAASHARATADTATATTYYNRALDLDPGNESLLLQSYSAAAAAGKIEAAIAAAKRYTAADSQPRTLANLLIATGHINAKDYTKAWASIDGIPKDNPLSFVLPSVRAWGKAGLNEPDAAIAELAPLESIQGLGDVFQIASAQLKEYLGRKDEAIAHYDKLAAQMERQSLTTARVIANGYLRLGQTAKAKQAIEKFRTGRGGFFEFQDITNSLLEPARVGKALSIQDGFAETYFALSQILSGVQAPGMGDLSTSFGHMALYLSPDLSLGRWVLGSTLSARQRFDESTAMLLQVRKPDPSYFAAQMQIIENAQSQARMGDALDRLQNLAREYPETSEIQAAIANLLRFDQKFAEAIAAYDKALQLTNQKARESWSLFYGRGIAFERNKQWKQAEADFQSALQLYPDQPDVLNYLGYSWIDRGENFEEARRLIELAYSKSPDSGYITDSLGWAMYLMGDFKGAVTYLEKAVELQPGDPTLNDHLGDAYYKVGRKREARFQWERALTLKPEDKQRAEIKVKLDQGLAKK
jgi:tetratricopeptide (TPR) repeat protein